MLARARSGAVFGVDAIPVEVECDVAGGLPGFAIVGLADAAVQESRERVRAALRNAGYTMPNLKVTINLAPANIRKAGPWFDLPIALGLLAATDQVDGRRLHGLLVVGELALDGRVRPVRGVLPLALAAARSGCTGLLVPAANAREASLVPDLPVWGVEDLNQAVAALGDPPPPPTPALAAEDLAADRDPQTAPDLAEVKGQALAKRALEVAAAGGHNLLLVGSPGAGKTMLARRLASILPPLTLEEALECTQVHSVAGLLPADQPLLGSRPFRAPHHSISPQALVGGSSPPRPGEISLAHHGVLFLDELPEFRRDASEALRTPLEEGQVVVSRTQLTLAFPAAFTLVAALNPCPCGFLGDPTRACTCTPPQADRYWARLSGPLLDRIDLQVQVPRLTRDELLTSPPAEPSATVRARVVRARERQRRRFAGTPVTCNARMDGRLLRAHAAVTPDGRDLLAAAIGRLGLSARSFDRVLRMARTIADLEDADAIHVKHLAEAIQYRSLDRGRT